MLILNAVGLQIRPSGRNKEVIRRTMMNEIFSEQFGLVLAGIVSAAYAWSWIRKILKSPKPYHKRQYFYITLAVLVIILGISTFFTKFTLNCLCGLYAGVSEFIKLYHEYKVPHKKGDMFFTLIYGIGLGCSLIMISAYFIVQLYFD